MSNIVVPASFNGQVAAVFQGQQAGDDLSGGITGGYGMLKIRGKVWSIQHNGNTMNLMRDDGDGPRGSVDLVIVKANPHLSKTWYENGWDENSNNPPDCASANGVVPDAGVPKQQNAICATCPKNAWGSATGGTGKGKACGDHRRLAIVPLTPTDTIANLRNEPFGGPLLLRCPAASLQDMAAFDSRYKGMGYPYFTMGVKIAFDPAESYPKLTFAAIRPLSEEEGRVIMELRNSDATARVISDAAPAQVAAATPPADAPAFLEATPATTMAAQVAVQPASAATPAPAVAQPAASAEPAAVVAPASDGGGVGGAAAPAASAGGFGAVAPAVTAQPVAPVAAPVAAPAVEPARTATQMTGFGTVAPEAVQQVTQQVTAPAVAQPVTAPAATTATAPGVVSAFEGSIDERLEALIGK